MGQLGGNWLLGPGLAFRKPICTGSRKPLNLYGGKWPVQAFRNHLILLKKWMARGSYGDGRRRVVKFRTDSTLPILRLHPPFHLRFAR